MKSKKKSAGQEAITEIRLKVVPRSSRNEIAGREGDTYKVKITSPPVDGLANKALVGLLSKRLGISKGRIEIASGQRSRLKTLRIHGLTEADVMALMEE